MKRTLEEILASAKAIIGEDNTSDEAIAFIEDITDSYSAPKVDWEAKYKENDAEWRKKYHDRFFSDVKPEEDNDPFEEDKPIVKTKFEELFEEV